MSDSFNAFVKSIQMDIEEKEAKEAKDQKVAANKLNEKQVAPVEIKDEKKDK